MCNRLVEYVCVTEIPVKIRNIKNFGKENISHFFKERELKIISKMAHAGYLTVAVTAIIIFNVLFQEGWHRKQISRIISENVQL